MKLIDERDVEALRDAVAKISVEVSEIRQTVYFSLTVVGLLLAAILYKVW